MTLDSDPVDAELKARHKAMWAMGNYPAVASELISDLGSVLVEACDIQPNDRVLDVACGSGNASIPAALLSAKVTACDLTPALLESGRLLAESLGLEVIWKEGDAEQLPFADGSFDVVMSCVGVMFAPHHRRSGDELIRVCRPGGMIGLLNWTPGGFIGRMFSTMRPYSPPPPVGSEPPPLWGEEDHVLGLLSDRVTDVVTSRQTVTVDRFETPDSFRDYFKANYGPAVAVYRNLANEPDRASELDRELSDLARRQDRGTHSTIMDWEYLLVTARRVG